MDERATLLRLLSALLLFSLLLIWVSLRYNGIPLVGVLPGDFELSIPGGSLYLPVTTSVLLSAILTFIAYLIITRSRNH
ncbi:MAG: DUF2905 domain-containing protein [Bacteroidetes bacterium]|nr:DUF2905 domain-containing protein [Bacteroidota bacterium]